jgi:hypothetical protein
MGKNGNVVFHEALVAERHFDVVKCEFEEKKRHQCVLSEPD